MLTKVLTITGFIVALAVSAAPLRAQQPGDEPRSTWRYVDDAGLARQLGLTVGATPSALAAQIGVAEGEGLVVEAVKQNSIADQAGIKQHDVLHKFSDTVLTDVDQLRTLLDGQEAGAQVTLTLIRGGKPMTVEARLGDKPSVRSDDAAAQEHTIRAAFLGVATEPVSPAVAAQLGLEEQRGVVTVAVIEGSPAAEAGLRRYDVIQSIDGQAIAHPDELRKLVRAQKAGDNVELAVIRQGKPLSLTAKLVEQEVIENPAGMIAPHRMLLMPPQRMRNDDAEFDKRINEMMEQMGPQMQRMREQMDQLMREPWQHEAPFDMRLEIPEGMAAGGVSVSSFTDGRHVITLTRHADGATLLVKDSDGNVIYDGPYDSDEDNAKVPAEIREKVEAMNKPMNLQRFRIRPFGPQPRQPEPGDQMV